MKMCSCFWFLLQMTFQCKGQSYQSTMAIFNDKLDAGNYHTEVRPIKDQSRAVFVGVVFEIVSIVKLDDVEQSFISNGVVGFDWIDEIVAWDPANYSGQTLIHPLPEDIWRPRVVLVNTLGDRDIFDDDKAPIFVDYNGWTTWTPGSLFPVSCELNLANYPFDVQTCSIQLAAMTLPSFELQFVPLSPEIGTTYFTTNGEWELRHTNVNIFNQSTGTAAMSVVELGFTIRRRPHFLLVNIVLPVVFLSFLNILVFAIPVESGEKISFGITVLLALTVFMSIVSAMLPRSSTVPKVAIYLFILLIISFLTVIDSIFIVFLYHMDEREEQHQKAKGEFGKAFTKVTHHRRAVPPIEGNTKNKSLKKRKDSLASQSSIEELPPYLRGEFYRNENICDSSSRPNKYKLIGKYVDLVSFVGFFVVWFGVTVGYMLNISLS